MTTKVDTDRMREIAQQISGPHPKELQVGDMWIIEREIDRKLNYNVCLWTGQYNFDKLVYEELDPHKIAEAKGEEFEGDIPPEGEGMEHLYEEWRKYLVDRFNFRREQIMVLEIINHNNDKKLIEYLETAKTVNKPYCEYIGCLKDMPWDWETLNSGFLSEQNESAVLILIKQINEYFSAINEALDQ